MKRFISYLYTYEKGIKGKNIGFIKTDIRNTACRMEMHVRGLGRYEGKGKVFLLTKCKDYNGETHCEGMQIGELTVSLGMGSCHLSCELEKVFSSEQKCDDMAGVAIQFGRQYYALSCWKDINDDNCFQGTFPMRGEQGKDMAQKASPTGENQQDSNEKSNQKDKAEKINQEYINEEKTENQIHIANADGAKEKMQTEDDKPTEDEVVVKDNRHMEEETPAKDNRYMEDETPADIKKIDVNAIHSLPKRNWYLCNNSFLIHGYLNYRYLILKKIVEDNKEKVYLGVPGIYEKPERVMATLFGFGEFQDEKQIARNRMDEEEVKEGTFGYWLCLLDM